MVPAARFLTRIRNFSAFPCLAFLMPVHYSGLHCRKGRRLYPSLKPIGPLTMAREKVIAWVKLLHVTAISFWAGGLICILFLHPRIVANASPLQVRHVMHFSLSTIIAPAAYIAIGSGAWLIFLRSTFVPWFSLKLVFVGFLVLAHMLIARSIMNLFGDRSSDSTWYLVGLLTLIAIAVGGILVLVLAKPEIDMRAYAQIYQPGALREFAIQYWPFKHLPL